MQPWRSSVSRSFVVSSCVAGAGSFSMRACARSRTVARYSAYCLSFAISAVRLLNASSTASTLFVSGAALIAASASAIANGLRARPWSTSLTQSRARSSAGIASHMRRIASVSTNASKSWFTPHATVWCQIMPRRPPASS